MMAVGGLTDCILEEESNWILPRNSKGGFKGTMLVAEAVNARDSHNVIQH